LYKISEIAEATGVKVGTIRFYEKCGFLEAVNRMPNNYRVFNKHHIFQVKICRLVFGGFVNRNLRKASLSIIAAAREWNLKEYEAASLDYLRLINDDIKRTKETIDIIASNLDMEEADRFYTKKQASQIIGVTEEAIRNWERNQLLPQSLPYQKRLYSLTVMKRMYLIRLLLHTGYSIMIIRKFFTYYDMGDHFHAIESLVNPGENEELMSIGDRYLQSLLKLKNNSKELCFLLNEMKNI
jgi:DNA-binding transcriptional MerR regulator